MLHQMTSELVKKLGDYLSGNSSHNKIKEFAWILADASPKTPPTDQKLFWSTVFAIIHLADEEHMADGCTKRELGSLLSQLKAEQDG